MELRFKMSVLTLKLAFFCLPQAVAMKIAPATANNVEGLPSVQRRVLAELRIEDHR